MASAKVVPADHPGEVLRDLRRGSTATFRVKLLPVRSGT